MFRNFIFFLYLIYSNKLMGYKKGEKITDEATLERLKNARLKALEVRKQKAEEKKNVKIASDLQNQKKVLDAKQVIKNHQKPEKDEIEIQPEVKKEIVKNKKVQNKKPKVIIEEVHETDSSSTESEPEIIVKKKRISKKRNNKDIEHVPQQTNPHYDKAYRSLFPEL